LPFGRSLSEPGWSNSPFKGLYLGSLSAPELWAQG